MVLQQALDFENWISFYNSLMILHPWDLGCDIIELGLHKLQNFNLDFSQFALPEW